MTSETSFSGNEPEQAGPAPSVPVQTPVPASGIVVLPVGLPPVGIEVGPASVEAGRGEM